MSTVHIETTPAYMDEDGDFVPEMEHLIYGSHNPHARAYDNSRDLLADHAELQAAPEPGSDESITPGVSMSLKDRDSLLLEALDAAALAKKAQGRARNFYNRGQIARNIGIEPGEVNDHGHAVLPEHMQRLHRVFAKLMGDSVNITPVDPNDNKRTPNDFLKTYYGGTKESEKQRRALRNVIKKRAKHSN